MKKLVIFAGICLIATSVYAYDETLIKRHTEVGGFFTISSRHTQVKETFALFFGGRVAMVINHKWAIGAGGCGIVNDPIPEGFKEEGLLKLRMAYGGCVFEYVPWSQKVFHIAVPVLVGAGKVSYKGDYLDSKTGEDSDTFFILEPEINLECNITASWRMDLGASYRYVDGNELGDVTNEDISGFSGNLTFKFGKF
jgi:hypothetical protein